MHGYSIDEHRYCIEVVVPGRAFRQSTSRRFDVIGRLDAAVQRPDLTELTEPRSSSGMPAAHDSKKEFCRCRQ